MSTFLKITNIEFVRRDIPQGSSGGTGYCEYDVVRVRYENGAEHTSFVPAYYNTLNTAWEEFYKDIVSCSNPEDAYALLRAAIGGDVWDSSFDDLRDSFKSPKPMPQKIGKKIYRIRKLTSRECFRLMGCTDLDIDLIQHYPYVPDEPRGWVLPKGIDEKTAKKMAISESQQYKMAGNSIVVQVLEGIFTQLFRKQEDVGISDFAVLSNGAKLPNMRFSESEDRRIAVMQRCLARKRKGSKDRPASNRHERYRVKLARVHRRVENRRNDFLHKTSTSLVRRYGTVCVEDLNVKGMMRNHSLAGPIASASWSSFVKMLEYKSEWYGVNLLRAGRFDPTSQTCSACGYRDTRLKNLSFREWDCPRCGTHHDRDVNAAVNIMNAAINKYFNKKSPAVTGITDADGADSENNAGTGSRACDYASDETSMRRVKR